MLTHPKQTAVRLRVSSFIQNCVTGEFNNKSVFARSFRETTKRSFLSTTVGLIVHRNVKLHDKVHEMSPGTFAMFYSKKLRVIYIYIFLIYKQPVVIYYLSLSLDDNTLL